MFQNKNKNKTNRFATTTKMEMAFGTDKHCEIYTFWSAEPDGVTIKK